MADKKPLIVIKKITIVQGGGHGGAWKVAFADFMTALMAFFLVMWLTSTASEEEKKAISDYFSTPSVIEYQFQNFGAEMTLEKLFLDLVNEPLKTLEGLVEPADRNPNVMHLGTKKIVMSYMAEQLGTIASDVNVTADSVTFEVPDNMLFRKGSADPSLQFVQIMDRVRGVTAGLSDSDITISSMVYREYVPSQELVVAKQVSDQRVDLLVDKVRSGLEHDSVTVAGRSFAKDDDRGAHDTKPGWGWVRFEIKNKSVTPDGKKPREIYGAPKAGSAASAAADQTDYDAIVREVSERDAKKPKPLPVKHEPYWNGKKKPGVMSTLKRFAPKQTEPAGRGNGGSSGAEAEQSVGAEAAENFPKPAADD